MHWDNFKQDNYSTVGGEGGCRVSEVWASTTSRIPNHKGFKLQQLSEIHPLHFWVKFQKFGTLRLKLDTCYGNVLLSDICLQMGHSVSCMAMLFRKHSNHQSRHQATSKTGYQSGDCRRPLKSSSGVWVGMCGYVWFNIITPKGPLWE